MKLKELKEFLDNLNSLIFLEDTGMMIPSHFHITEAGLISRKFIDCGGTLREENTFNFQIWVADDIEHRLSPVQLKKIIQIAVSKLNIVNDDIEISIAYQHNTIGMYALEIDNNCLKLSSTQTNCLAIDQCGTGIQKINLSLASLSTPTENSCSKDGGCC